MVSFVSLGSWNVLLFGYDAIHEAFVKNAEHCSARKMPITQKAHGECESYMSALKGVRGIFLAHL